MSIPPLVLIEVGDYVFNSSRRLGCSQLVDVVQKSTGKLHCGKLIVKEKMPEFLQQEGLVYQVLRKHPHPNIQLPTAVVEGDEYCGIIFPSLGEDCHSYARRSAAGLPEREARPLFRDMVSIVEHLHAHRIVVRDLRLGKFFLKNSARVTAVLSDFDSAQVVSRSSPFLTDRKGSPAFVGPEVVVAPSYDGAAADMWSLGVVLFLLLRGSYPFHDPHPATLFQKIQQGHAAVSFPASMSESARDVICSLLTKEPHLRPTASQLAKDLWVSAPSTYVAPPHPFYLCFAPVAQLTQQQQQQQQQHKRNSPDVAVASSSKRVRAASIPAEGEGEELSV